MNSPNPGRRPLDVQRQILHDLLPVARAQRELMHSLRQLAGTGLLSEQTAVCLLACADQLDASIHDGAAMETELARHTSR